MDRKMKIITGFLNEEYTIEDLAERIIKLERINRELIEKVNNTETNKIGSIDNKNHTICNIVFIDDSQVSGATKLKLDGIPTINQKLFINVKGSSGKLFNIEDVVIGLEIDKRRDSIKQSVALYVKEIKGD